MREGCEFTGKAACWRIYERASAMAGMSMDSGQSQSRRPSFMGSLEYLAVLVSLGGFTHKMSCEERISLSLGPVKVIFVQDKSAGEDVAEEACEGCLAAGGAAGEGHDEGLFVCH